ncbi:MAG: 2'-5' RNA ligase family protein [Clostridia bacterium]|nr:2'-5' RNA ligase family protein [Clostridia bacterium]MCI9275494.1 2'-5' RNA ligase family protein [Clostridia bacterium]
MYDYVLQYGFDKNTQKTIQEIKGCLKKNKIEDRERNWLPHITIDLYNCKSQNEFIEQLDKIVGQIESFEIECKNLNNFDEETLYIEPYNKENLMKLKLTLDKELSKYRLETRKKREYRPHITLCTNDNLTRTKEIAKQKFEPFVAKIEYLWVYNCDMELIKEYELKS